MIKDYCVFFILVIGSICMGKIVVVEVGSCLGKIILELGGNNVIIVMLSVDINVVFIGVFFGVVGIVGQCCIFICCLIVYESFFDEVKEKMIKVYG